MWQDPGLLGKSTCFLLRGIRHCECNLTTSKATLGGIGKHNCDTQKTGQAHPSSKRGGWGVPVLITPMADFNNGIETSPVSVLYGSFQLAFLLDGTTRNDELGNALRLMNLSAVNPLGILDTGASRLRRLECGIASCSGRRGSHEISSYARGKFQGVHVACVSRKDPQLKQKK